MLSLNIDGADHLEKFLNTIKPNINLGIRERQTESLNLNKIRIEVFFFYPRNFIIDKLISRVEIYFPCPCSISLMFQFASKRDDNIVFNNDLCGFLAFH